MQDEKVASNYLYLYLHTINMFTNELSSLWNFDYSPYFSTKFKFWFNLNLDFWRRPHLLFFSSSSLHLNNTPTSEQSTFLLHSDSMYCTIFLFILVAYCRQTFFGSAVGPCARSVLWWMATSTGTTSCSLIEAPSIVPSFFLSHQGLPRSPRSNSEYPVFKGSSSFLKSIWERAFLSDPILVNMAISAPSNLGTTHLKISRTETKKINCFLFIAFYRVKIFGI